MTPGHPFFAADAPLNISGNIKFGIAHAFNTAGNNNVSMAGLDFHCRKAGDVQSRATPSIKGNSRHRFRPAGAQKTHAGNIHIFAVLVRLAHNDFIDLLGSQSGSSDGRLKHRGRKVKCLDIPERPHITTNGCSHGTDDHGFFHFSIPH